MLHPRKVKKPSYRRYGAISKNPCVCVCVLPTRLACKHPLLCRWGPHPHPTHTHTHTHKRNCPPAEGNATDVGGGGVPTRASSDYTGEFGLHRRVRPGRWRNGAGPLAQWSRAAPRIPKASPPNRWSIMAASLQKRSKMIEK